MLVLATGFGLYRLARDGRFRGTRAIPPANRAPKPESSAPDLPEQNVLARLVDGLDLGERATLLQFSSAFCAPCRVTRRVLAQVAEVVPGVRHVEVDAEGHLDLVRRLGITRTPTTLVLDATGREVARAAGAPRKDDVLATLARAVPSA